jgi:hypothetical protein
VVVPARVARSVRCLGPERQPVGVPVPTRFVAVAVIRCVQADQVVPGRGLWEFELWQVAEHGLARLTAALRRPSAMAPPGLACAEPGISVPPFVVVGSDGRMIYPSCPPGNAVTRSGRWSPPCEHCTGSEWQPGAACRRKPRQAWSPAARQAGKT